MKKMAVLGFVVLIVDQLTKLAVINLMEINSGIQVLGSFFSLTFVKNYGAAFSIFSGSRFFLIAVALATLVLIYFMFLKDQNLKKIEQIAFPLLIGGIVGNLIDRIVYGYVIDFFDFNFLGYNFPIFNVADIFIVLSMFLILITMLGEKNDKFNNK